MRLVGLNFWAALSLTLGLALLSAPELQAASPVQAQGFTDPQMDARYQALIAEFRCPKCLNTNLKGSDSPIAVDLRRAVARLLRDGKTDQQVREYLQERYGDFVLYNPPFKPGTYVLWLGPLVLFALALVAVWRTVRRARQVTSGAPDDAELARVLAAIGVVDAATDTPPEKHNP